MRVRSGVWGAGLAALCTAGVLSVAAVAQQAAPPPTPPATPPAMNAPAPGGASPAPQANAGQPPAPDRAASRAADRAAFFDARLAAIHAGLQLSPDQEALWGPVESAVRDGMKSGAAMRQKNAEAGRPSSWFDAMRRRAEMATTRGAAMKRFADAAEPLYTSLSDDQKRRLRVLMRPMGPRMMPPMGQSRFQGDERGGPDRMGPSAGRYGGRDRMDEERGGRRSGNRFGPQDREGFDQGGPGYGDRSMSRGDRDGRNTEFADRFRGRQPGYDGRGGRDGAFSWHDRRDGGSAQRGPSRDMPNDDDGNDSQP